MRVAAWMVLVTACGGSQSHANGSNNASPSTTTETSGTANDGASGSPAPTTRSGLQLHLQNVHASGPLPEPTDPQRDQLTVTFEMVLSHTGDQALTGINVVGARLVHDDGRAITFGVGSVGWDGRLDAGAQRTVAFTKTQDSAHPIAGHQFCGQHLRLEVTLDLAGRQAVAQSRHVLIECPH